MSLLGTQVYANPDTPIWFSAAGGAFPGDISTPNLFTQRVSLIDSNGVTHATTALNSPITGLMLTGDSNITFGKTNTSQGNTVLTLSTFGANLDSLVVGGAITCSGTLNGIGPNPSTLLSTSKVITPVTPTVTPFLVDFLYPTILNAEYDVASRGAISYTLTPAADDVISIIVRVGSTGNSRQVYNFFPAANPGITTIPWVIRDRLICDVAEPSAVVSVSAVPGVGSTAVYTATQTQFDITRVA